MQKQKKGADHGRRQDEQQFGRVRVLPRLRRTVRGLARSQPPPPLHRIRSYGTEDEESYRVHRTIPAHRWNRPGHRRPVGRPAPLNATGVAQQPTPTPFCADRGNYIRLGRRTEKISYPYQNRNDYGRQPGSRAEISSYGIASRRPGYRLAYVLRMGEGAAATLPVRTARFRRGRRSIPAVDLPDGRRTICAFEGIPRASGREPITSMLIQPLTETTMKNVLIALSVLALVAPAAASAAAVSNPTCCLEATPVNLPTPTPVPGPNPAPSAPSAGIGGGLPLPSQRDAMVKPVFVSDEAWASMTVAKKLKF